MNHTSRFFTCIRLYHILPYCVLFVLLHVYHHLSNLVVKLAKNKGANYTSQGVCQVSWASGWRQRLRLLGRTNHHLHMAPLIRLLIGWEGQLGTTKMPVNKYMCEKMGATVSSDQQINIYIYINIILETLENLLDKFWQRCREAQFVHKEQQPQGH